MAQFEQNLLGGLQFLHQAGAVADKEVTEVETILCSNEEQQRNGWDKIERISELSPAFYAVVYCLQPVTLFPTRNLS
eukprot:11539047-Karenia_brevis.AAC.1